MMSVFEAPRHLALQLRGLCRVDKFDLVQILHSPLILYEGLMARFCGRFRSPSRRITALLSSPRGEVGTVAKDCDA
jgi:hypothetical protein